MATGIRVVLLLVYLFNIMKYFRELNSTYYVLPNFLMINRYVLLFFFLRELFRQNYSRDRSKSMVASEELQREIFGVMEMFYT